MSNAHSEFSAAVVARLAELGRSQQWLGAEVARIEGRGKSYGQGTIGDWLRHREPAPSQAIAMEKALEMTPGALTRLLGFLPIDAVPALSVPDAIDADPRLSDAMKRTLKGVYRELRS